jgi:TRAP transporter 4TM/12TM fusion protein
LKNEEASHGPATNRRRLGGLLGKIIVWFMIVGSLFHLYTGGFGLLSTMSQRSLHLMFMMVPVFFLFASSAKGAKKLPWYDILFGVLVLISSLYILLTWSQQTMRVGDVSMWTLIFGAIMLLGVIEATRRTASSALALIAGLFLLYTYFGKFLPGGLAHRGYSLTRIIDFFYATSEGIYGMPIGVSASLVVLFVIFGGVLSVTGGGQFFIDSTFSVAGRWRGGTAKTAVVGSSLMGMISGSPIANVATVGTFTIPLMKRGGFSPNIAAAIEALSSSGGILMPPVMGAAAFIMAEYLGKSYNEVCVSAIIPAVLYYACIFVIVDLKAVKEGLVGFPKDQLPDIKQVMKNGWHLIIPIIALIGFLMIAWSPNKAVFWSIVILAGVSYFYRHTRLTLSRFLKAMEDGAKETIPIAVACAGAGIIVGSLGMTGLGVKFSSSLMALCHGSQILALILTMIASLILGMGMPATAVYILSAALLAPPLINLGITPIAAHFFIFYFSVISCITPPVALTAYAAAGLAKTDPGKAGWTAFYYGILAYIIPYMFVYTPVLLWQGDLTWIILSFFSALIGVFGLGIALEGYLFGRCSAIERVLFAVAGLLCVYAEAISDVVGVVLLTVLVVWHRKRYNKLKAAGVQRLPL